MNKYNLTIIELMERMFLIGADTLDTIKNQDLTILVAPFADLKEYEIDIPENKYYRNILAELRNGRNPAIILSDYNLDRLIIETIKGKLKSPRIFMQTAEDRGPEYYKDKHGLIKLVEQLSPERIYVGGAFQSESTEELKTCDLKDYDFEEYASYVGSIYLTFRDKYDTQLLPNLIIFRP